jgi:hypothetical protein
MVVPRLPFRQSRWASLLSPLPGTAWACGAMLLLGAAFAGGPASDTTDEDTRRDPPLVGAPPAATDGRTAPAQGNLRVREGTEIVDQLGYFRITGGRVVFVTDDGKRRFVGLENLNLERIARTVADSPQPLRWGVTGTITEYRGANFLLVRRAILKSGVQFPGGSP